jgi:ATP-dependent Clp protease ATP-binding subunit ClpC
MFERFTDRARGSCSAQEEARLLNHCYIGPSTSCSADPRGEGVAPRRWKPRHLARGRAQPGRGDHRSGRLVAVGHIPFTPRAKKVLELSPARGAAARPQLHRHEHILLGLIREGEGVAAQVLVKLGADLAASASRSSSCLSGYQGPAGARRGAGRRPAPTSAVDQGDPPATRATARSLDQFGRNLTQLARERKLDPVIGRTPRARAGHADPLRGAPKNNPVLIGEPASARRRSSRASPR